MANKSYNKVELVDTVYAKLVDAGEMYTKKELTGITDYILDSIQEAIVSGRKVTFPQLGSFERTYRESYMGRNPQTGEDLEVPAKYKARFKESKALRDKLSEELG